MEWVDAIGRALDYIEAHITDDLTIEMIANQAFISPFYFQKGFSMLCGFTVGDYIRQRRLTLAGSDLISTDAKIIEIALKYGYESPDSFTKAFTRFHGVTPTSVRKDGAMIKSYAPLRLIFSLEGGCVMDYKIVDKAPFTVMGASKVFKYEGVNETVSQYWTEHYQSGRGEIVCGMYGVSIDESMRGDEFEYLIADDYHPGKEVPSGFITKCIPEHTWAVFACKGNVSNSMHTMHQSIFSDWLPNHKEYEIAAGYHIEKYNDPAG